MTKPKTPSKSEKEKALTRTGAVIAAIVGVTVILTFLIKLPQEISTSIDVFRVTEALTPSSMPKPLETFTPAPTNTDLPTATDALSLTLPPTQVAESPEPTPIVLFGDSFETNANDWSLGNRDGNITKQDRQITSGALQLDFFFYQDGAYGWVNVPKFQTKDFYMTVDVEIVQFATNSQTGIVFPFRMTDNGNTSYAIEFNNDGTFALYFTRTLKQDGHWKLIHRENSDLFQLTEGTTNNFAIRVIGQKFTTYINQYLRQK